MGLDRLAIVGSLVLAAKPVWGAELTWNAPQGCTSDGFVQKLEDSAERPLTAMPVWQIAVFVRQTDAAAAPWQLELSFNDPTERASATRTIVGVSCDDVSRAAAVAVAMALHEEVIEAPTPEKSPATDIPAAPVPQVTNDAASQAVLAPPTAPPWRFPVHALVGIDGAIQGTPSLGAGLGVGVATGQVFGGVRGVYWLPVTLGDELGIELHSALLMVDACVDLTTSSARPRVCFGYEGGAVMGRGTGAGLAVHRKQTAVWHALKPEVGLVVDLDGDLFFSFMVAGVVALADATFVFDEGRVAHDLPSFSLRGNAGLGWAF